MARIALLSNPRSTGNRSLLPRVRSFCDQHQDIFHYEVDQVDQIGAALRTIARVQPRVLVINGGDGTVQATLTEMINGGHFGDDPPPVAVLPNGKTNLIAHDLGAEGDPIEALARYLEIARTADLAPHIVTRELISLTGGTRIGEPVVGMFLGGAGLANTMLYCRNKLYPLGLPNGIAHFIAFFAGLLAVGIGRDARFLPAGPSNLTISMQRHDQLKGRFAILMVTTLEQVLLKTQVGVGKAGVLKLLVVERRPMTIMRGFVAAIFGRLGRQRLRGLHLERSDEIRIEGGEGSNVILDGELYSARVGRPIVLTSTAPVPFLKLAA
jgi:hypothetical protein